MRRLAIICCGITTLCAVEPIAVNQVGYLPDAPKYCIVQDHANEFTIRDKTGKSVYSGTFNSSFKDKATGQTTARGSFDSVSQPGTYTVQLPDGTSSYPFMIADTAYNDVTRKSLKSFYYQRCGIDLTPNFAGIFSHPACHKKPVVPHKSTNEQDTKEIRGGWHDAGDYGRYIHSASVTIANMMIAYESHPENFAFDDNSIPESGNGIPDFLDEMAVELDWFLLMQNRTGDSMNGAVHYMINSHEYTWCAPDKDRSTQYLYNYSSVATADFAAIMAQASRIFASVPSLKEKSESYLNASLEAWKFLEQNPKIFPIKGFVRPSDTETGGYCEEADREDRDDRTWAAVELFLTTGEDRFHTTALSDPLFKTTLGFEEELTWMRTYACAFSSYLLRNRPNSDKALQDRLKNSLLTKADDILSISKSHGYGDALTTYYWGSSGSVLNLGLYLAMAFDQTGKEQFRNGALEQLNYLLGVNGLNTSFVSGIGSKSPQNIHHAQLASDTIDSIFPGLVAGGPNESIDDDNVLSSKFSSKTPPALCYVDDTESYASNENCILYTAPLVALAGWFSKGK